MAKSEYPIEANTLGKKIRKSRMDKGWTLLKVANMIGISESYLARIEADKQIPLPSIAEELANALKENPIEYTSVCIGKYIPPNSPLHKIKKEHKRLIAGMKETLKKIDTDFPNFSPDDRKKLKDSWEKSTKEAELLALKLSGLL